MNETKDLSSVNVILDEFMSANAPVSQPQIEGTSDDNPFITPQEPRVNNTNPEGEPVGTTTAPEASSSTAQPEDKDSENVSWDSFVTDTPSDSNPAQPDFDWAKIGTAIGIKSEIKSQTDVTNYISGLEKTINDLKANPVLGDNVPRELKEALEIASKGGDYLAYLEVSSDDYASMDPVEIYEDAVAELFMNSDGTFREKEYNDYLDRQDPMDQKLRGLQIQKELIATKEQKKQLLQQRVNAEKAENLRKLENSLNEFKKVGNFEVTPKIKKQLHEDLSTGKFLKELGINLNGSHNWESLLNTYFKAKYFDAVQAFNEKQTKNQVLRGELNKHTNPSFRSNPDISNPTETRKASGVDLYLQHKGHK